MGLCWWCARPVPSPLDYYSTHVIVPKLHKDSLALTIHSQCISGSPALGLLLFGKLDTGQPPYGGHINQRSKITNMPSHLLLPRVVSASW